MPPLFCHTSRSIHFICLTIEFGHDFHCAKREKKKCFPLIFRWIAMLLGSGSGKELPRVKESNFPSERLDHVHNS